MEKATPFTSFVALGDSFTEGMSDQGPDGSYRGWADLVAARLAGRAPGFRYANLAVRGKLIGQIAAEQVPVAAAMNADLVSLVGGINDVLRPKCDVGLVCARLEEAAETLAPTTRQLVLFRSTDPTRRMRGSARLLPRVERLHALLDDLARRHDAVVVDLFGVRVFDDPRLWAEDRLHLNTEGHRRVAEATLRALGYPPSFDWTAPLPPAGSASWADQRRADLRWARVYLGPWIGRRLTGRSSGDGRAAKRADLEPWTSGPASV
ncbi:GDSL family lipase [Wenjunlia vitaminophila]|uniref:GDSL family lipase n=1 Tax=Wenjunlia vitaminophila TaxID=76728 RepID=A0A0T6LUK6_WENVI|nr:SGNH/GDSL hydrolase family protein [Wenjunlia vitaminophila]KRV49789.1 GDSL family lipase [Wenjunlia vitaminophila]